MCGRYVNDLSIETMVDRFHALTTIEDWKPQWNCKPTTMLPIVTRTDAGGRRLSLQRWGWIRTFLKPPLRINAIGEKAATTKTWAKAFATHRCLIPASHFYEWTDPKAVGMKLPHAFRRKDGTPFAIAGLYETITEQDVQEERFILLTAAANDVVKPIHHRMAAMLRPSDEERWLDPTTRTEDLESMMSSFPVAESIGFRVPLLVNNIRNDGPELLQPVDAKPATQDNIPFQS